MRTAARRSGSLLAAALAAVALAATAVVPAAAAGGGTPPPGTTSTQDTQDTAETLAVHEAARTGKPVEVLAKRSETSDTVAQPDGKLKTTTYVQPKRVRKNGAWVELDPTLQSLPGGAIAPKGSTADLRFSGGGSAPLVTMARAGKELKLSWPKPLPKPTVNGATAEYASILPDVDLRLSATKTGFTQVIVVHTAEAAKNPELDQLRLGLQGHGLTFSQESDGTLKAKDPSGGGTVFEAPVPVMWDSSKPATVTPDAPAAPTNAPAVAAPKAFKAAPQAAPQAGAAAPAQNAPAAGQNDPAVAGYGDLPGEGAKMTRLKVDLPKDGLVLSPDQGMLDAPDTVYPVMIDPAWNTPHAGDWAGVSRTYPNQAYWHFTYNSTYVHDWGVGYCGDTSRCAPTDVKRAFFQMPNPFVGKQVLSATFGTYESWSYSCDARPVELWSTGYISPGLNWNAQNASGFWSRYLQTINTAKGWSGNCPGGWLEYGETGAVRNLVQDAANWGWPTITFGLKAQNEGDTLAWKRFTDDAYLSVYYNLRPNQIPMSDMTMSPGSVCQYPGIKINKMPQVTTRATDPDGEAIGVQFAVGWDDGTGLRRRWWSTGSEDAAPAGNTFKASGSIFSWPLPTNLPQNLQLDWEARAWDGAQWGPWSSDGDPTGCYFIVDTSAPDGPAITSDAYPGSKDATAALPWTDGVGRNGNFTLKSAATDVVKYQWGLDTSPSAANEVATSGGAGQTIRIQPQTAGVHFVSARAVDGAGNASQPETYYFNVLSGQTQRTGWSMDDPSGTSVAGTGGSIEATLGSGATPGAPGHLKEALALDGTPNGYAETQGTALNTTRGFAVSAWVNLTDNTRNRVAVSENGSSAARFALGLFGGKWTMWTSSQDNPTNYALEAASSDAPVVLGQWTHLVGAYDPATKTSTLYVNGVPGTPVTVAANWDVHGALEFGRSKYFGNWTDPWKGSVDEVRLWDRPLSKAEAADVAADKQLATGLPARSVWHLDGSDAKPVGTAETDNLTAYNGVALGKPGIADKAIHLDGTDDYLRGTRPQVDGSRDFSVSAWVKLPAPTPGDTTPKMAVTQIGQHNNEFSLYYSPYWGRWIFGRYKEDSSADTLVRTWQDACTAGSQINGVPCFTGTTGEWTHLLGVSDTAAKKLRFYINGFLVGQSDYTQNAPWANPGPIQIGAVNREGVNGEFFGGDIDDVRLYDRVVTGPEAGAMVQQRPQLAGRWKLNAATGTPAVTPDEGPAKAGAQLGGGASIKTDGGLFPTTGTLQLDGSTGYAATGSVPLHTGQSFTLAGWANTAGVPTRKMTALSVAGANNSAVTVRWVPLGNDSNGQPYGQWEAEVSDTDANTGGKRTRTAHTSAVSVMENWTHLAVSYDAFADRLALYVNGQVENQGCADGSTGCTPHISWTGAPQPFEAGGGLQFGRNKDSGAWGEYFSGELDDVWLYQGVLSPAQITKLADYNAELGTSTGV
ncbi:LamG-like jellyroll fold domain-containing protein [Kitasatospora sp. NPDC036755]|uniref:LamG-like jellyroll fold domain-containing protein n=1 Tax=Kitasatospora sp. NPDC036755 TaxID=3154600 RepID=UPI0033F69E20